MAGKQTKGDRSRNEMIRAAIRLYSRLGYDQTTFQRIGEKCKVSHTALIYHFKHKSGLFHAVVDHVVTRVEKIITDSFAKDDTALTRITKIFHGYVNWSFIYKAEAEVLLLLFYYSAVSNEFAAIYDAISRREIDRFEELLMRGQREGLFPQNDHEEAAVLLYESLLGLLTNRLANRKRPPAMEKIEARARRAIEQSTGHGRMQDA